MQVQTLIVFLIIGFILYKVFGSSNQSKPLRSGQYNDHPIRRTGRGAPKRSGDQTKSSFVRQAQRQERAKNYDEASRLFLRGGQVFSAAKMKAMKGPHEAAAATEIIRVNSPHQLELITRNLVNEFFYRLNQPATAAALLRSIGLHDEATAVEVAANLPVQTPSMPTSNPVPQDLGVQETQEPVSVIDAGIDHSIDSNIPATPPVTVSSASSSNEVIQQSEPIPAETSSEDDSASIETRNIPNSLMMASSDLDDKCVVCKRQIESGDSFIYCVNCGRPGHFKHLAEIMKVTGKCPNCKERLVSHMYDLN